MVAQIAENVSSGSCEKIESDDPYGYLSRLSLS